MSRSRWPLALAVIGQMIMPGAWAGKPGAAERTSLRCEAVYMPARSSWVREVELLGEGGRLSEVRIDGLRVHAFSVSDTTVLTSLDNERIQIDIAQRSWRSDFRGLASGQGRCDPVAP